VIFSKILFVLQRFNALFHLDLISFHRKRVFLSFLLKNWLHKLSPFLISEISFPNILRYVFHQRTLLIPPYSVFFSWFNNNKKGLSWLGFITSVYMSTTRIHKFHQKGQVAPLGRRQEGERGGLVTDLTVGDDINAAYMSFHLCLICWWRNDRINQAGQYTCS